MPTIRIGEREDSQSLADLWCYTAKTAHSYLRPNEVADIADMMIKAYGITELLVFEKRSCPAGYMMLQDNLIQALYVLPRMKRFGIGTQLLEYARNTRGWCQPLRTVVHDGSLEALVFFLKKGFRHEKRETMDGAGLPYVSHHLYLPPAALQ